MISDQAEPQSLPVSSSGLEALGVYRWWRGDIVGSVDHERVVERIIDDSGWSPRYLFMTMMSAGIAVLGLLLSSPAVVIGAMLISPLMSPILGLGFSLALFDFAEMRRSLTALAIGSAAAVAFTALIVLGLAAQGTDRRDPGADETQPFRSPGRVVRRARRNLRDHSRARRDDRRRRHCDRADAAAGCGGLRHGDRKHAGHGRGGWRCSLPTS